MFQVTLGNKPRKFYNELDEKTQKRINVAFEVLETNPWPAKEFDLTKIDGLDDCFRIRIGKHRICYHVNTEANEISVYRIERRSETTYK